VWSAYGDKVKRSILAAGGRVKLEALSGKVAILTGAGSGIGAASARMLAGSGVNLTLVDYNQGWLDETAAFIRQQGQSEVLPLHLDISHPGSGDFAVEQTLRRFGRLDVGINIAAINQRRLLVDISDEDWNRVIGINLYGTFNFCRAYARVMVQQRYGVIVNCSSVRAFSGLAECAHYTAAKAGVDGLTYSMAIELAPFGVRVNAVAPAGTATNMALLTGSTPERVAASLANPGPTTMTPDQVARTVVFLASDESDLLNGQVVGVVRYRGDNVGNEVAPRDHTRVR
jgi:3-oxoacyl-[acyl-carrier protein] reductase